MAPNKKYIKPEIFCIKLDNEISLVMMTPVNPPPRGGANPSKSDPFASPFGDKPFG